MGESNTFNFNGTVYAETIGDNFNNLTPINGVSPLESVIQKIKDKMKESDEFSEFMEELLEFTTTRKRKIIGLENKLKAGNRDDLIEDALHLKNKFERKLAKKQMFTSEQKVYIHVLAYICTTFNRKILPQIKENKANSIIDSIIFEEIVKEVYTALINYDDMITTELIQGMLYYLTGKCHIVWS